MRLAVTELLLQPSAPVARPLWDTQGPFPLLWFQPPALELQNLLRRQLDTILTNVGTRMTLQKEPPETSSLHCPIIASFS